MLKRRGYLSCQSTLVRGEFRYGRTRCSTPHDVRESDSCVSDVAPRARRRRRAAPPARAAAACGLGRGGRAPPRAGCRGLITYTFFAHQFCMACAHRRSESPPTVISPVSLAVAHAGAGSTSQLKQGSAGGHTRGTGERGDSPHRRHRNEQTKVPLRHTLTTVPTHLTHTTPITVANRTNTQRPTDLDRHTLGTNTIHGLHAHGRHVRMHRRRRLS